MPRFAEALAWHVKDRRLLPIALVRLPLCSGIALAPLVVGLPTHDGLVSVAYFLPAAFGVLGAISFRENIRWLRPRNPRLWVCRAVSTASLDFVCLLGLVVTLSMQTDRGGILAGALLGAAVGMMVACFAEDLAWLAAALVGAACLMAIDRPLVSHLSIGASSAAYVAALLAISIKGPVSRD